MKKIAFLLMIAVLVAHQPVMAQKNFIIDSDSTLDLQVYAGLLNHVEFATKEIGADSKYDLRFGAIANWQIINNISLHAVTVYGRYGEEEIVVNNFSLRAKTPNQKWSLEAGRMATSITEMRPIPATSAGHFETWTQSRLPGSALGVKVGKNFKSSSVKLGVAERDKKVEFSAHFATKIGENEFNLAGMINENYKNLSLGLAHKIGNLYQVFVYAEENNNTEILEPASSQIIAYFGSYGIRSSSYRVYLDAGYNLEKEEFPRLEFGLLKNFAGTLKGLAGVGYSHEIKKSKLISSSTFK